MQIIANTVIRAALDYNEAEVRFYIVDPILRELGYPDTGNVYLNLEEKLEYPYIHIGRRSKKDQPLGYPDYRAGIKGARGSFIVEAKAGSVQISLRDIEQAHSYAAHAQVGANYFVLCNGIAISVYETLSGPGFGPISFIPIEEINERFHELENILSPERLRNNCRIEYDKKLRICEGLGSKAAIRSGRYFMASYEYRVLMNGQDCTDLIRQAVPSFSLMDQQLELMKTAFELRVSGGYAERGLDGRILAHANFSGATVHNDQAMAIIGINEVTFTTADEFISIDPNSPTIFESLKDFSVSQGTALPHLFGGSTVTDSNLEGNIFIKAAMYYRDGKMMGQYVSLSDQCILVLGISQLRLEMDITGTFELVLDV
ncbi:type I restriction enzyme HsdR N-terminal domain-containing protein [Sphingobium sp. B11D3D]|uniref:type I restriction enzyme HsdR N-terminal domain-containing protein n=1 Tax=Sphingobium sp. B11D3D TaxID=2940576 RepID=UPI0022244653|nr:type I restriction enzyme HsdR N-terminal domain-containing protein [Sphingobium sp. B11D3D]MCW2370508.1 hypothetical protein [Sphingobium sp. B11D3D]